MKVQCADLRWIASQSLVNCHAEGVDSVMFDNTPGARIRAFVAHVDHTFYLNDGTRNSLGLAIHPHHCDLTLRHVFGPAFNMEPVWTTRGHGRRFDAFRYVSQITYGKGGFERIGTSAYANFNAIPLVENPVYRMASTDLHTVYVHRYERAAWYVHEHRENPRYKPVCWSDRNLCGMDFSKLYQPMSIERLLLNLELLNVEIV